MSRDLENELESITETLDRTVAELRRLTRDIRTAEAPPATTTEESQVQLIYDEDGQDGPLAQHVRALSDNVEALRYGIRDSEVARRRESRTNRTILAMLAIFVVGSFIVGALAYSAAQDSRDTNRRIADCTTLGGKCNTEANQRTGGYIANITRGQIAVGECSRLYPNESGPAYDAKLRACVYDRIADDPSPQPSPGG